MTELAVIRRITLAVLCLACFGHGAAEAHTRSESYSHWYLADSSVTGTVTIPLREVMLLYQGGDAGTPPRQLFQQEVADKTSVMAGGRECALTAQNILQAASGFVRVELTFDCETRAAELIRFAAMFDVAPAHVNFAKLHRGAQTLGETLFTESAADWNIADVDASGSATFASFLGVGIAHIAGGYDHIAFLLGMLLVAGSIGRSVIAVTGFTLGHSISLAAAVLGYVHADGQLVEAFIGFTVALMALEYFMLRRPEFGKLAAGCMAIAWLTGLAGVTAGYLPARAGLAYFGFGVFAACYLLAALHNRGNTSRRATMLLFVASGAFGLVHGFGFAGFLMQTGLLGTSLFVPMLGFNLGVELGQLLIVAIALLAGMLVKQRIPAQLPQLVAAGLCGIGVFWFVGRTLA